MPVVSGPIPVRAADDIWHQHEAQIKDLYQNQRKTLREVKQIMEESGFPKTPLSTWESKLREELQLRKKAKSHDWPLIYRHVLPRLEQPGKKKLKRKTVVRLNGSEIPWDKAWKEIRRSGAIGLASHSTSPSPLPPEVTIRSPSPRSFASPPTPPASQPVVSVVSTRSSDIESSALVPLHTSVVAPPSQARNLIYSFSVDLLQWCASSIPWLQMCQSVQQLFLDGERTRQLEQSFSSVLREFLATSAAARAFRSRVRHGIIPPETRLDLLLDHKPMPPRPSPDLGYQVAKSGGQIELRQFVSTAIFLLSNNLHDSRDGDQGLQFLCSLLDRNTFLTSTLLQSHLPSFRAAWEALHEFSLRTKRENTCRALTDIGIHNHWLSPVLAWGCLRGAVEMDCWDVVSKLVVYYCRSSFSHWWRDSLGAILVACRKGNVECASLLLRHCNVNAKGIRYPEDWSMFQALVANLDSNNDEFALALDLFLANGADVDQNSSRRITRRWRRLVDDRHDLLDTRPTILDEIFYINRMMFDKAQPYSRVPISKVTRTGLLVALQDGLQTLREYLSARQPWLAPFDSRHEQSLLELLLAEQFAISRIVDMKIVRGLFELDVNFKLPSIALDIQEFWRRGKRDIQWYKNVSIEEPSPEIFTAEYLDFAWHRFSDVKENIGLLNMLLAQGSVISEHVLEGFVAEYGTSGLGCLEPHVTDFPNKAVRALVRAARLNKFEDVEFLLRKGVNPNSFILTGGKKYSVQAAATHASYLDGRYELPDGGCSLEMIQFLASHGARLAVTPEDSTPLDFAYHLLQNGRNPDLLAKIKYVVGTVMEDKPSSRLPSFLLESCFTARRPVQDLFAMNLKRSQLETFEYLYEQGTEVSPGSPLAALVKADGREELVRHVLYSGSDLNAYQTDEKYRRFTPLQAAASKANETLVHLFLLEGANVNSPAHNDTGMTALQAICRWGPATEEEHQRKMRICLVLIGQGADVNPARPEGGITILQDAAIHGDLELAALLLREGADVNAASKWGTSLDRAAEGGRLDMVEFLLNANALSCVRGASGYRGAICKAEDGGHLAVADLIRKHAAKVEAGTVFNPELLKSREKYQFKLWGFDTEDDDGDQ